MCVKLSQFLAVAVVVKFSFLVFSYDKYDKEYNFYRAAWNTDAVLR